MAPVRDPSGADTAVFGTTRLRRVAAPRCARPRGSPSAAMVRVGGEALAGDEAAAAHEVEVRDVMRPQVRIDDAGRGIGAHPVRADLVAGDREGTSTGRRSAPLTRRSCPRPSWPPRAPLARRGRRCTGCEARDCRSSHGRSRSGTSSWRGRVAARSRRGFRAIGRTPRERGGAALRPSGLWPASSRGCGPRRVQELQEEGARVVRLHSTANCRDMAVENPMR